MYSVRRRTEEWELFRNYIIESKFHSLFILFKFQMLKANSNEVFVFQTENGSFLDEIQHIYRRCYTHCALDKSYMTILRFMYNT